MLSEQPYNPRVSRVSCGKTLPEAGGYRGLPMPFRRNGEIFGIGEPAEYLYRIVSGVVRTYGLLEDGRRQIFDFHFAGEIIGLDSDDLHMCAADAVSDVTATLIRKKTVVNGCLDADVSRLLLAYTSNALRRSQDHALTLIRTADERVAYFLLEMFDRERQAEVYLPMCRQDIADYLGLTIETVSRVLAHLVDACAIELRSSRHLILRSRTTLARLSKKLD